jgi:hypothetical protein
MAEINAMLDATTDDASEDTDPQQPPEPSEASEHPMMAFINLMLKDLNTTDDASTSSHASPDSASPRSSSLLPSRAVVSQYQQKPCLTKMLEFCSILPDWYRLQALLRSYLWNVDWKFLITCQDALETQMHDLWLRVISPAKSCDPYAESTHSTAAISFQPGDLSRLALLASVLGETIESMDPDAIAQSMPASRPGVAIAAPIKLEADANARVRALLILIYHVPALIEECVRLDEMTIDLVQANLSAFSLWSNQGLHGTGSTEFPRWNVTIRAAKRCNLFEDPGSNASYSQPELDHRRRLAWLVYGYDHAFAVGANTRPLIVESQFSVDQPSDAAPWSACGAPRDACLAMLEVQGGKIAELVSSTLCYGPPLHRKAMETDSKIMAMMAQLHPSYMWDNPDVSFDQLDPFRARRRCWLQLTTAWQRGSLHRQFFFPNGRITNGELATSRHIATDSALRSINAVRELRKMQNRFSDHMGSAWWFQYLTEPSMTLATAALLLIRSRGQGVPGLANEASCWPTMMHFSKMIDLCVEDLAASMQNSAACLPSFLTFGQGCLKLIEQLRSAIQTSFDAFVKSQPDLARLHNLKIDEKIIALLHPRSRQKSPSGTTPGASHVHSREGSSSGGATAPAKGVKRPGDASARASLSSRNKTGASSQDQRGESRPISPRSSLAVPAFAGVASSNLMATAGFGHNAAVATQLSSPDHEVPSGELSLSFAPSMVSAIAPAAVAAPHFGVPAPVPEGQLLSPAEPFALREFYTDVGVQRATSDWLTSIHMSAMLPQPPTS